MISPFHSHPQRSQPTIYTKDISRRILVNGAEHVLSHGSTSQYNRDGTGASACGLAALNFARIVFSKEQSGLCNEDLLQAVLARECAEETTAICALWSGDRHLEVEDISRIPLFEKTLKLKTTTYGLPGVSEFNTLLTELSNLDSSAVVIITRPPEIIACLKLRLKPRNVFIIFDSHPRPSYPSGAGMIISPSIEGAARWLTELFPSVDLPDCVLQWQAQLLANYSGHVFVPRVVESTATLWQAVLEFSLAQLSMRAEIAELQSQNEFLKGEQQRLESELIGAEARSLDRERLIQQQQKQAQQRQQHSSMLSSSEASTSTSIPFLPDSRSFGSSSSRALGHFDKPPTPPSDRDDGILAVMGLQNEFGKEDRALSAQVAELAKAIFNLFRPYSRSVDSSSGHALGHLDRPSTPPSEQCAEPAKSTRNLFVCDICLEEMPDDSIARPDPCQHNFCRECLRGHVIARLNERRFPILCPSCSVSKGKGKGKDVAGEISQSLALDLGLTDEQFSVWSEMEMVAFSVSIHCRKCQRTMFVAKDEHEEARTILCPLPDCDHVWCKQCQQSIDVGGPKHSCDGTSELDHLVKQEGWKYCPTCKTPIQKRSGCNHMRCITPACNTHFCYICGGLIVKSAVGHEISEATTAHFSKKCVLFEVPK